MTYTDEKGRIYKIMPSMIRDGKLRYVTMFRQPHGMWFIKMPVMPWRQDADTAQKDLDELAARKGWMTV